MIHSDQLIRRSKWIADGLGVIQLTALTGATVNAYLIESNKHRILIDAGYPSTLAQLEQGLATLNTSVRDISRILYTHTHVDHMGGGVALDQFVNVEHVAWKGTHPLQQNYYEYYERNNDWLGWIKRIVPPGAIQKMLTNVIKSAPSLPAKRVGSGKVKSVRFVPFRHIEWVGDIGLQCLDARGHDPFHVVWLAPERGWIFTGDVVLRTHPPITSFLGDKLTSYRETLQRLDRHRETEAVLPGHGMPRNDFQESLHHAWSLSRNVHDVVVQALQKGAVSPINLATEMLPSESQNLVRLVSLLSVIHSQLLIFEQNGIVVRHNYTWRLFPNKILPRFMEQWGVGGLVTFS